MPMENWSNDVLLNQILEPIMCVSLTTLPKKPKNQVTTGMVHHFQRRDTQRCAKINQGLGYDFIMTIMISPNQL